MKSYFFMLFSLIFLLNSCRLNNEQNQTATSQENNYTAIAFDSVIVDSTYTSFKSEGLQPTFSYFYPIFKTNDTALNRFLNQEVKTIMHAHFEEKVSNPTEYKNWFTQILNEDKSIVRDLEIISNYYLDIRIDAPYEYQDYLTIAYYYSSFLGGAHPAENIEYYVFNTKTKSKVSLQSLLNEKDEKLLKLGETAFRKDMHLSADTSLANFGYFIFGDEIYEESDAHYGKFHFNNNFAVTPTGIYFYYNNYEIAPYAAGASYFTLSYTQYSLPREKE